MTNVHRSVADRKEQLRNIYIMVTIDKSTYSSIPSKFVGYIHHFLDAVAAIEPVVEESQGHMMDNSVDGTTKIHHAEWILTFKDAPVSSA